MKQTYQKQDIAQLLSKFMAGETSVAEEEALAQYFRTHEVSEEWAEYKEMFALFDSGQVDVEPEADTSDSRHSTKSAKIQMLPKAVQEKPKIKALRWLVVGIAASIALLVVFHLGRTTADQPSLVAETAVVTKDSVLPEPQAVSPTEKTEETLVAQVTPTTPQAPQTATQPTLPASKQPTLPAKGSASSAEDLANCIARLEAEMENLDDSVNSKQLEKLIAADVRLQQMVNRIVGKQVEQAINEFKKDTTTNYISF